MALRISSILMNHSYTLEIIFKEHVILPEHGTTARSCM